jgi:opacity protein-like surface antigen
MIMGGPPLNVGLFAALRVRTMSAQRGASTSKGESTMSTNNLRMIALGSFLTALAASSAAQAQLYYRVDTGYSKSTGADIQDKNFALDGIICGDAACNTPGKLKDVGSSIILGLGAGYRFNSNIRGDVTLAYRPSYKLDASDGSSPPVKFKADVNSLSLMANGYYDFPMAAWIPYVGAGLGFAQNKVGTISFSDSTGLAGTAPGGTKSGLAWAVMAGAGIPLPNNLTLDVGYRYIDLGKLETASGNVTVAGFGTFPYSGAAGKLRAHELTLGVRF